MVSQSLLLQRVNAKARSTLGQLSFIEGGDFRCWTLEDALRAVKIPKETAIPEGRYRLRLTLSARFGRMLPEVVGVENFTGIRIHAGNRHVDTEGCPLVGLQSAPTPDGNWMVSLSRDAMHQFWYALTAPGFDEVERWIEVRNPPGFRFP